MPGGVNTRRCRPPLPPGSGREVVLVGVEQAAAEEQQVRRHRRSLLELHELVAAADVGRRFLGRVRHDPPALRHFGRHFIGRPECRFVPAREPLARQVGFALREDRAARLAVGALQVDAEDAFRGRAARVRIVAAAAAGVVDRIVIRLEVDDARPFHVQRIVARRDRAAHGAQLVEVALVLRRRDQLDVARLQRDAAVRELDPVAGDHDVVDRLQHLDLHVGTAVERVQRVVRAEPQPVVHGYHGVRQLDRRDALVDVGCGRRRCARRRGDGGRRRVRRAGGAERGRRRAVVAAAPG